MGDDLAELGSRLRRESAEYRRLWEEHRAHEERLAQLRGRHILSDEERLELKTLKKRKLQLKDRMTEMAMRYREAAGA